MNGSTAIPIYNITIPIKGDVLTVQVRGDQHYGAIGVNKEEMVAVYKQQQDIHRGNLFVIDTGDLLENNLNNSIGHGYDIEIKDPQIQINHMRDAYIDINKHLYSEPIWNKLNFNNKKNLYDCRHVGVFGNHEYRSRKTAGVWILDNVYNPSKTLNMGVRGIINLKVVNETLKLSKTYKLFIAHRPSDTSAGAMSTIIQSCRKIKADITADAYIFGHYHKRVIWPEYAYDEKGLCRKVMFVINPSPMADAEYAEIAGFSPVESHWFCNFYLPIDKHLSMWANV